MGKRYVREGDYYIGHTEVPCVYCGLPSDVWDHVIPYSYGISTVLVRACNECNSLASDSMWSTITDKQTYIKELLKKRYSKVLNTPTWSDDEMEDLGYNIRVAVKASERLRTVVLSRLAFHIPDGVLDEVELYTRMRQIQLDKARKGELA